MEITTARLKLKEVSLPDIEMIHRLHSFIEVDKFNTQGIPGSITDTELLVNEWVAKQEMPQRISYIFSITLVGTNEFIGLIALNIGKSNYKIAEAWYKLDPAYWQKG